MTQAWAEALALGDDVFAERFGIAVEPGWEGYPEVMALLAEVRHASTPDEWGLHLVFDEDGALVGNAGWKGEPVDGAAELGYAVAPSRRGRGIATAVVHELLARARAARLRTVVAHTLAEASPSTSVLARSGFANVGEVLDPDDGPIWRWELSLPDQ
ncbi:MAG: GNAT family N-acetyltransferase [Actinobacteria bacterium]|nr:GNAT family N-acetyltransferase [Actinomycetota bacterium]